VLGGTGFIGGRLVEVLSRETTAEIRVLVRNFARLPLLARFQVELVHGDVADREVLSRAISGCDMVINCTYGKGDAEVQRAVNIDAVKMIIEECARLGVGRIVHLSTVSVYGEAVGPTVDETSDRRPLKSDLYGITKLEGERLALRLSRELNVSLSVLQPAVVYGPYAPTWTIAPLAALNDGQFLFVDEPRGRCNHLYIDNLIDAIILAATEEKAAGEVFIITDGEVAGWKEFFSYYARCVGLKDLPVIGMKEYRGIERRNLFYRSPFFKFAACAGSDLFWDLLERLGETELPFASLFRRWSSADSALKRYFKKSHAMREYLDKVPSAQQVEFYSRGEVFSSKKAMEVLGYKPRINLSEGMKRIARWYEFSGFTSE